ncbi:hypothetical protein ACFGZ0_08100 [Pasteurella multocida]|nr:hypothetical protein [Pasteurella multocida]
MFSNEIIIHKELVLELAFLVSITEDTLSKTPKKEYSILFNEFLNQDELDKLSEFASTLDLSSHLENILSGTFGFGFGFAGTLTRTLNEQFSKITEKYSDDPHIKKILIQRITDNGFNILNLSESSIKKEMAYLPEIKFEIIKETAKKIIQEDFNNNSTEKEKKLIIASLLDMAYSNCILTNNELELINFIANELALDPEYVNEFITPISQIALSMKEVIGLINE